MAKVSNLPFKKNSPGGSVKTKISRPPHQKIWISRADPEPRNLHLTSISGSSSIGGPWPVKPNFPRTALVYTCWHGFYSIISNCAFSQSKVSWVVKESLGLEKKTTVSNALLLNHLTSGKTKPNFKYRPDVPGRLHLPGTYHPLLRNLPPTTSAWDLLPPAQNLPPPVQLQMPSQLKISQNLQPD